MSRPGEAGALTSWLCLARVGATERGLAAPPLSQKRADPAAPCIRRDLGPKQGPVVVWGKCFLPFNTRVCACAVLGAGSPEPPADAAGLVSGIGYRSDRSDLTQRDLVTKHPSCCFYLLFL